MTKEEFDAVLQGAGAIVFTDAASAEDRRIEGDWISIAAKNGAPIRISGGIVDGPIALDNETIAAPFELISCKLQLLTARYARFSRWVRLELCELAGACILRGAVFDSALWLRGSTAAGNLDLGYARIAVDLDIDGIRCHKRFYLAGVAVANNFHARGSTLEGPFLMPLARIGGQFDITRSKFSSDATFHDSQLSAFTGAHAVFGGNTTFDRTSIFSVATFSDMRFSNTATFCGMDVRGQFVFDRSEFTGECHIEGSKANDAFFRNVVFRSISSFIGSQFFSADFTDAQFYKLARFNDLRIESGISAVGNLFAEEARFDRIKIGETLKIGSNEKRTTFADVASFAGMRVGSQVQIEGATFEGPVFFDGSIVDADLSMDNSDLKTGGSFRGCRCKGDLEIANARVGEMLSFHGAEIHGNFVFDSCELRVVDCSYVTVQLNLAFQACKFTRELILKSCRVRGDLGLTGTTLAVALTLETASVGAIEFIKGLTPRAIEPVPNLRSIRVNAVGLRYGHIYCVWQDYISGLDASNIASLDPYVELEKYLRSTGQEHWADDVYVHGRLKLRQSLSKRSIQYYWDWLLWILSGYGLKPRRALLALVILLVVTTALIAWIPTFASHDSANAVACSQTMPDIETAVSLAVRQFTGTGNDDVNGWRISFCPLFNGWLYPYSIVLALRGIALIIIPFTVATVTGLLKYIGHREYS
jgi:uncharacterized protein YjbI with pentapeptide repeats